MGERTQEVEESEKRGVWVSCPSVLHFKRTERRETYKFVEVDEEKE